ncbi:MAG: NUDIX domain-containing protein [bacterium]
MAMSPYIRSLRAHVGTARLLMPSVAGIVRAPGNRLLLVQQRDDGKWSTPGGSIEIDETPADSVVREVWEETGLFVTPRRVFAVYGGPEFVVNYPNGDETQYISVMFECDVTSGELRADGDEIEHARFVTYDEASRLPLTPWLTRVLPRFFERSTESWFEPSSWRPSDAAQDSLG